MYVSRFLLVPAAALITACGAQDAAPSASVTPTVSASVSASDSASAASRLPALAVVDPWVKTTGDGMTAAFGTLVNNTDADVTVTSAASPLSPKVELHEVADAGGKMVMRPKKGGFVIPAQGRHELTPGGDHIMLMDVTAKVEPGAEVPVTLTLADGATLRFTAIGKDFAGGDEDYHGGDR